MHFLLLKIASSVGMGLVLKRADARGLPRLPLIRVNYAVAAVLAFFAAVAVGQTQISLRTAVLAVVVGVLFVAGLIFWVKAIEVAGLARSVVAMRLAVVIPVATSVVVWHERPAGFEIAGSVVAVLALALVIPGVAARLHGDGTRGRHAWFWMLGVFAVNGMVNTGAKYFQQEMPQAENLPFQTVVFIAAFLVTTALYYIRKARVTRETLSHGAVLGVANLGNYLFLILALTMLPGTVVYPAAAAGEVGLMALAGVVIWREKVGLRCWLGIGLAVLALVLLQVGS